MHMMSILLSAKGYYSEQSELLALDLSAGSICVLVCYHIAWLLLNVRFKLTYFRDRKYA